MSESDVRTRPAGAALLWILLLAALPFVAGLDARDTTQGMEAIAISASQETWRRMHDGEPHAWLMPTEFGKPRIRKPPLTTWLHLATWTGLDPQMTDVQTLVARARIPAVGAGLAIVLATFVIGVSLRDRRTGVLAALAVGVMFLVQKQARIASYDVLLAAGTTWTIACMLFAERPMSEAVPSARRRYVGWIGAALAFAFALGAKGPVAIPLVLVPWFALIACARVRRDRLVVNGVLALGVGALFVVPWFAYVWATVDGATEKLATEYAAEKLEREPILYYVAAIGLALPWTAWVLAGLVHPFVRADETRRAAWWGWAWFVVTAIVLTFPDARQQRYILPAMPALALLVAIVIDDFQRRADAGAAEPRDAIVWKPHWGALLAFSVITGPFLALIGWFVARGVLPGHDLATVPWWFAIPLTAALFALAMAGWRAASRGAHVRSAWLTGLWMALLTTVVWHQYASAPTARLDDHADLATFAERIDHGATWQLIETSDHSIRPGARVYLGTVIRQIHPPRLDRTTSRHDGAMWIIADADSPSAPKLETLGFAAVADGTLHGTAFTLWERGEPNS